MDDLSEVDIEIKMLEEMSEPELEELAINLDLIDENGSVEELSDDEYRQLLRDIIKERAESDSFQEMRDEEQEHGEQLKRNERFSD